MSQPWRDDDERTLVGEVVKAAAKIRRPREAVADVIDLPVLRPEHERVAKFVGSCIGIGACYLIAGAIWTGRGVAWAVRRLRP
jgi:hypothetical protein